MADPKTISVTQAIARGLMYVNGPVFLLLFVPSGACMVGHRVLSDLLGSEFRALAVFCTVFLVGFVLAWLWWSYSVPRWRLWAYERVDDIARLKRRAVEVGLTWPDGSIFAKTEMKSKAHAQREYELESQKINPRV